MQAIDMMNAYSFLSGAVLRAASYRYSTVNVNKLRLKLSGGWKKKQKNVSRYHIMAKLQLFFLDAT